MILRDIYNRYVIICKRKISMYFDEYHIVQSRMNRYYNMIAMIISSSSDRETNDFIRSYRTKELPIDVIHVIETYLHYKNTRLTTIKDILEKYIFLSSINYEEFRTLILNINTIISATILSGIKVIVGRLGSLVIYLCKRNKDTKKRIDFNATRKYKLLSGAKYATIYHTNDIYPQFVYFRNFYVAKIRYYSFKPTNFINLSNRSIEEYYKQNNPTEDVLYNSKIGNVQKMNTLLKNDYNIKLNYQHNNTKFNEVYT